MNDSIHFLGPEHVLRVSNQGGSFDEGRGYNKYWVKAQRIRSNRLQ